MSLKIGIVGLPNVGKSTLFQALTKKQVDTSNYPFATIEPNVGIVAVEDERLGHLERLMKSARAIPAVVEFVDIAGLVRGASTGEGLGNQFLSHIREVDAIVEVVRSFEDENITHMEAGIDPERDRLIIETELFMADLATAEKALERASKNVKTGASEAKERLESAKIVVDHLKKGNHIPREYLPYARELSLLSVKPMLYLYNTREENFVPKTPNSLALNIKLEEELSRMSEDEIRELELKPRLGELIGRAYELLGLISFFTTGEDETRAWTIPKGSTAKRAGRAIHSDFEEKFIRAEVILWEDLLRMGSFASARESGLIRTEGKDYIVKDGDVIEFKI